MSRMYAFHEVSVIVLPQPTNPSLFKDDGGQPLFRNGDKVRLDGEKVVVLSGLAKGTVLDWCAMNGNGEVITLEGLQGDVSELIERACGEARCRFTNITRWGPVNPDGYCSRGWCCSEFAIANYTGTIANDDRKDVQAVMHFRKWPTTVQDYQAMMSEEGEHPVRFTRRGDVSVVQFLFYRVCFGMIDSFYSNSSTPTGYIAPNPAMLNIAEQMPVGHGDGGRQYYL
eukprot:4904998-Prymnesium_polylepis.2